MSKVVILNGPPGVGKDTLGAKLIRYGFEPVAFKEHLYEATADYYGLPLEPFVKIASHRTWKEIPSPLLNGKSPREALIHVSEDIMKPQYGNRVFGEVVSEVCFNYPYCVITDGGFKEEMQAVEDNHELVVIRLHRNGCTFDGDSRSYAQPDWFNKESTLLCDIHLKENDIQDGVLQLKNILKL